MRSPTGCPCFRASNARESRRFSTTSSSRPHYDGAAEFWISKVEMVGNTGTYLDSPFHRHRDTRDLSEIPLEDVAGLAGVVLEGAISGERAVSLDADESQLAGRAVLVRTGWDARWGTDAYWEPGPYISPGALELLLRARPKLVGVDFWNVDDTGDPSRRGAWLPVLRGSPSRGDRRLASRASLRRGLGRLDVR